MVNYKKYDNGLRLIVNTMDAMMSVSAGILVGAGSCLEDENKTEYLILSSIRPLRELKK